MKHPSKRCCNRCGEDDNFEIASFNPNNNSYKAMCCDQYLCFVKYDDDDYKAMKKRVREVLKIKMGKGDFTIDKYKLARTFPDIYGFILFDTVERIALEYSDKFKIKTT